MLRKIKLSGILVLGIMFITPAQASDNWFNSWFPWIETSEEPVITTTGVGTGGGDPSIPDPN